MPPRYLTYSIVAFWLATTAWLFHRELWPRLRPGEPPSYTIDLADEAQRQIANHWTIYRGGNKVGHAHTRVVYREADDTHELRNEIENLELTTGLLSVTVPRMTSMYRVGRDGELREMTAELSAQVPAFKVEARLWGQVRDGRFWPRCRIEATGMAAQELKIEPFEVSSHGSILNPLHPVNRITGLRPGQTWQQPIDDPLMDALAELVKLGATGPRCLRAQVLPELQVLSWKGREIPCLVIEYTGDQGVGARTWVRQDNGVVLKQEAHQGIQVELVRDR